MSVQKVYRPQFLMEPAKGPGASEGGAAKFTELTDGPGSIKPDAILVGNEAGTALEFRSSGVVSSLLDLKMRHFYFYQDDCICGKRREGAITDATISFDNGKTWRDVVALTDGFGFGAPGCYKDGFLYNKSNKIYRTSDFVNWEQFSPLLANGAQYAVFFMKETLFWIGKETPSGTLFVYANEDHVNTTGLTKRWQVSPPKGGSGSAYVCHNSDSAIAILSRYSVSECTLYISQDSGQTFTVKGTNLTTAPEQHSIYPFFFDGDCLYIRKDSGTTWMRTFDFGDSWQEVTVPFVHANYSFNINNGIGFVVARNYGVPIFYYTSDNMHTWQEHPVLRSVEGASTGQTIAFSKNKFIIVDGDIIDSVARNNIETVEYRATLSLNPPADGVLRGVQNNAWTPINAPKNIEPGKILVGNADGTGFEWKLFSELAGE